MAVTVFEYCEFQRVLERFSAQLPDLLASHHATVDLVPKVVDLLNVVETPFTVAIVGQMRVGKSSLLNALIGVDLAVTGVTETTATINWFKYGEPPQCDRFRVIWKDRPAEEFLRSEIMQWVGDSRRAEATKYIEFFANAQFLRLANVVDTPGTRSTIGSHEQTTQDFLALRREQETHREGSAADAILYVLMPVARQNDHDLLTDFESGTRLAGSFPYNSLAIMHKWETLEADDPLGEAQHKAERLTTSMADLVAKVIPVSAPLAMAAERLEDSFWAQLLELSSNSSRSAIEEVCLNDKYFTERHVATCALDQTARKQLRTQSRLPWPSFKMVLKLAEANKPGSIESLRSTVGSASGIHVLREELQQRFFSRSKMIKAFSVLAKAWEPCQIASARLRNYKVRLSNLLVEAEQSRGCLAKQIAHGLPELLPVQDYIAATKQLAEDDLKKAADALRDLGEVQLHLRDAYEDMNADVRMLEFIDRNKGDLEEDVAHQMRCLFGYRGLEIPARIQPWLSNPEAIPTFADIRVAITDIRKLRAAASGELRRVFEHAETRLEQIADSFEEQSLK